MSTWIESTIFCENSTRNNLVVFCPLHRTFLVPQKVKGVSRSRANNLRSNHPPCHDTHCQITHGSRFYQLQAMLPIYAKIKKYMSTRQIRVTEMFRLLDKDRSGTICCSELHATLANKLGIDVNEEEVAMIFRDIDGDGDTEVSYKEFCEKVNSSHFAPLPKRRRHTHSGSASKVRGSRSFAFDSSSGSLCA